MKKLITIALALVLALSLAACGGGTDNGDNGGSNSTNPPASQSGNETTPSGTGGGEESGPGSGGTEWPNYDYLQDVPKPDFTVTKIEFEMKGLPVTAYYSDVTFEQMEAFSKELDAAGWSVEAPRAFNNNPDKNFFWWAARNGEENGSFQITLTTNEDKTATMLIGMPR
jgi:hypothetical protein